MSKAYCIVILICISISCNHKDFYEIKSVADLYVMPLIKPYRLKEVDLDSVNLESCQLDFKYNIDTSTFNHINVTDVNVIKGMIYGHGKRTIYQPNDWFVIIPGKKIERKFQKKEEWEHYLLQSGIDSIRLYSAWALFYQFQKTSKLPWYNSEISKCP